MSIIYVVDSNDSKPEHLKNLKKSLNASTMITFSYMKVNNAIGLTVGDKRNNAIETNEIHLLDQGENA